MMRLFALLTILTLSTQAFAEVRSWNFEDPKGVNAIGLFMNSTVEPMHGFANGISGIIHYNPESPETFRGEIVVKTSSIRMSNATMTEHLHSADWLNASRFSEIRFVFENAEMIGLSETGVQLDVHGTFKAFGHELKKTVPIVVSFIPDGANARGAGEGDLLLLRSQFDVTREDLDIKPDLDGEKVANTIHLNVAIAGYEAKSE